MGLLRPGDSVDPPRSTQSRRFAAPALAQAGRPPSCTQPPPPPITTHTLFLLGTLTLTPSDSSLSHIRSGVDIIEAGFPIASPDDFAAVRAIAMDVGNTVQADGYVPVICGLSRTRDKDLETAWEAVRHAKLPRVHTFIATSGGCWR